MSPARRRAVAAAGGGLLAAVAVNRRLNSFAHKAARADRATAEALYFDALHRLCTLNARACAGETLDDPVQQRELGDDAEVARRGVPWYRRHATERNVFLHFTRTVSR